MGSYGRTEKGRIIFPFLSRGELLCVGYGIRSRLGFASQDAKTGQLIFHFLISNQHRLLILREGLAIDGPSLVDAGGEQPVRAVVAVLASKVNATIPVMFELSAVMCRKELLVEAVARVALTGRNPY